VIGVPNPPAGENIKAFVDLKDGFQGKMKEEEIIEWNPASSSVRGKTESGFDFLGYPFGPEGIQPSGRESVISLKSLSGFMSRRRPTARWGGSESMSMGGCRELPAIASAAPTAPKTTAGSATPPAGALFLRLINLNGFAVKGRAIHLGYRRFSILILSKSHESKAPRAPRIAVCDDLGFGDFSMWRERLAQAVVRRVPAQTTYK
jgi:hypothetical protein